VTFFHCHQSVGGGCSLVSLCGRQWCYMDISASDVYRLTAEQLRKLCLDRGLDCKGQSNCYVKDYLTELSLGKCIGQEKGN
jgi:hypothetical protein